MNSELTGMHNLILALVGISRNYFYFPALIPFSLPTALGLLEAQKLDTQKLKISFILKFFVIAMITINLNDAGIFVIQRNPLAHAVGIESAEVYLSKTQPSYAQAVEIVGYTPQNAKIYALFKLRSCYMNRDVQPDPILDNLAHDIYLHRNPEEIFLAWKSEGYTHVLLNRRGFEYLIGKSPHTFTKEHQTALNDLIQNSLEFIAKTEDGSYELYEINNRP